MVGERRLDEKDVAKVLDLISSHPGWSRTRLSVELAQLWQARNAAGQWKDMSVRNLLLKLERRGLIVLPAQRRTPARRRPLNVPELFDSLPSSPVTGTLSQLQPLCVERVRAGQAAHVRFEHYLAQHHYLGYRGPIGEHLDYLIRDRTGRDLACLLFSGAAWKTQPRDAYLGWDADTRIRRLSYLTNNTRFLILPWVHVPHLASHLLGLVARRLAADWQIVYGHPIYAVETFVEHDRFRGTCYKAANWIHLGQTQGRSRDDRYNVLRVPVKDIYFYPLTPSFRERLLHADA